MSGLAINVDTFKGTVQLSWFANSAAELRRAEAVADFEVIRNDLALNKGINIQVVVADRFVPSGYGIPERVGASRKAAFNQEVDDGYDNR